MSHRVFLVAREEVVGVDDVSATKWRLTILLAWCPKMLFLVRIRPLVYEWELRMRRMLNGLELHLKIFCRTKFMNSVPLSVGRILQVVQKSSPGASNLRTPCRYLLIQIWLEIQRIKKLGLPLHGARNLF